MDCPPDFPEIPDNPEYPDNKKGGFAIFAIRPLVIFKFLSSIFNFIPCFSHVVDVDAQQLHVAEKLG